MDPEKLLFVFVVAIIVFGPDKLPQIAKQMAYLVKKWHEIRDGTMGDLKSGFQEIIGSELPSYQPNSLRSLLFENTEDTHLDIKTDSDDKSLVGSSTEFASLDGSAVVTKASEGGFASLGSIIDTTSKIINSDKENSQWSYNDNCLEEAEAENFTLGSGFYEPSSN